MREKDAIMKATDRENNNNGTDATIILCWSSQALHITWGDHKGVPALNQILFG